MNMIEIMVVEKSKAKASIYGHAGYTLHKTLSTNRVNENQTVVAGQVLCPDRTQPSLGPLFSRFLLVLQSSA